MLAIADINVFVSDFERSLHFYLQTFQLELGEKETSEGGSFARLDFPDGGPSIQLWGPVEPWPENTRPELGSRPTVRFDIITNDFDGTLVRALEAGGAQDGEIETHEDNRYVTVADPDGNTFELLEVPADFEFEQV